jgi:ferredoxin
MNAIVKFTYVRSKSLMEMYRTIPCQNCGADDGTVCGAHSNLAEHGKGRGIKASDEYCASLCNRCHVWLDQGPAPKAEKIDMHQRAMRKTGITLTLKYGVDYTKHITAAVDEPAKVEW